MQIQPVQAPVTVPISFQTSNKSGIVTATSANVQVTVSLNDTVVVEAYIAQTAGQFANSISDTQTNTYSNTTVATSGGGGGAGDPFRQEFWTTKATASGSLTVTVSLSASASFGVIVAVFRSAKSIGNVNSRGNLLSPGTGQHVDILQLTIQDNDNWVVGGYAGDKLYECIAPMQGTPPQCFSWSPLPPVMTLTQAIVDLATASADLSYGGPFTAGANDYEMTGKGSLSNTDTTIAAIELVCCETGADPEPDPDPDGGSAGPVYVAEYVTYSILALLVLAALAFVFAGRKKAALVALPVIPP